MPTTVSVSDPRRSPWPWQLEEGKLRDNVDSLVPSRLWVSAVNRLMPAYHVHWIPQVIEIQYIRGGLEFGGGPGRGIVRASPFRGIHANWG